MLTGSQSRQRSDI